MDVLAQLEPKVEVYSIDEAFVAFPTGKYLDLESYAGLIRDTVQKNTGIPVSIGFGPTKTLAKIANRFAKKSSPATSTFVINGKRRLEALLGGMDVSDIWGIGRRHADRLKKHGVHTARELMQCDDAWIKKQLTVTGLRTVMELRGTPCINLEEKVPAKKSICTSRSFGQAVHTLTDLQEAIATYATQAAFKLRRGGLHTTVVDVFIRTNSFKKNEPQYCNRKTLRLAVPSSHTATLIKAAIASLEAIYRPGYNYQKAGVLLSDLVPEKHEQLHLFKASRPHDSSLMKTMDKINKRWGHNTIQSGSAGLAKGWHYRQLKKSPSYTTRWSELPIVKASFPEAFSVA
jgi:DNA polymerase V